MPRKKTTIVNPTQKLREAFLWLAREPNGKFILEWLRMTYHERTRKPEGSFTEAAVHAMVFNDGAAKVYLDIVAMIKEAEGDARGDSTTAEFDGAESANSESWLGNEPS